ncbi:hypothetical protein WBJ53_08790 [Spirosoma sp. SC4-14]|uniref:hypothetical protein n=1 Tax=Spirosoma sp. SC4-14 TaxID=3128900 RepID=UPI0030D4F4CA
MTQKAIDIKEARQIIRMILAKSSWILPVSQQVYYSVFAKSIKDVQAVTVDLNHTAQVLSTVLNQGWQLNKSVEWINQELLFEAHAAYFGDRLRVMLFALKRQRGSDEALDLYNERLRRFDVIKDFL